MLYPNLKSKGFCTIKLTVHVFPDCVVTTLSTGTTNLKAPVSLHQYTPRIGEAITRIHFG